MAVVNSPIDPKNPDDKTGLSALFGGGQGNFIAQLIAMFQGLMAMFQNGFGDLFGTGAAQDSSQDAPEKDTNTADSKTESPAPATAPTGPAGRAAARSVRLRADTPESLNRQADVTAVLHDAARAANVSPNLLMGVWGKESTFGRNLVSPTGCLGDFQFSRLAMVERIADRGHIISARLREMGFTAEADNVSKMHEETRALSVKQIRAYAVNGNNLAQIDKLRMDGPTSAYAAAFHLRSRADELGLDSHKEAHFGMIYAGYNVGAGHAMTMMAGKRAEGWEIEVNKGVAGARDQRASYQNAVVSFMNSKKGVALMAQADHADQIYLAARNNGIEKVSYNNRTGATATLSKGFEHGKTQQVAMANTVAENDDTYQIRANARANRTTAPGGVELFVASPPGPQQQERQVVVALASPAPSIA